MNLATMLSPSGVFLQLEETSKKQLLKSLAAEAEKLTGLSDSKIYSVMMDREHAGCTGVGDGVGIPHGRFEKLDAICALFATLKKPVEFGAADGKPVDLVFMLLSPAGENTAHLKAMATISRLLRDRTLCDRLRREQDKDEIYTLLTRQR